MDYSLYKTINGLSGPPLLDHLFRVLADDLSAVLVVLVAMLFLVPAVGHVVRRRSGAVLATAGAAVALLLNQLISRAVDRPRPYLAHPAHAHLLIARSHDPSFPSDHATGAFALAFGVWLYDRAAGSVLLVLAAILAFARVYVGTHYPGDVLAGALIGVAVVAALYGARPARSVIELVAQRCGAIWDTLVGRVAQPRRRIRA